MWRALNITLVITTLQLKSMLRIVLCSKVHLVTIASCLPCSLHSSRTKSQLQTTSLLITICTKGMLHYFLITVPSPLNGGFAIRVVPVDLRSAKPAPLSSPHLPKGSICNFLSFCIFSLAAAVAAMLNSEQSYEEQPVDVLGRAECQNSTSALQSKEKNALARNLCVCGFL